MKEIEEGQDCPIEGCGGAIEIKPTENCSCHIYPPCHGCVEAPFWCPRCKTEGDEFYEEVKP